MLAAEYANQSINAMASSAHGDNNVKMESALQLIYAQQFNAHSEQNASEVNVFQSTHAL